ncbi:MAG TPA: SCP2 sterol-binding domain-containing protein [Acidimicrobiia bacterium]|nr:SCP2 sterol-binding domain-containing protein [Acidimicrobiia bacterium]
MPEFLSRDWIEALDAAARAAVLPEDAAAVSIEIEQVVRDAPGGEVRYHLRLEDGRARVQAGPATSPDLRLIADYDVAARIQRGEVNAQEALAAGRLKVQGQFAPLVRANDALNSLEDVFAGVRAATTYEERRRPR